MNDRFARLRPAILPLALALALLALAIPLTGAAFEALYAGDVGAFIGIDVYGTPEEANRAAGILETVDDRFGDARARVRAGTLRVFLAYAIAKPGDRGQLMHAAVDLSSGLARAPAADAMAWAALAQAGLGLGQPAAAARALGMSLRLAADEPRLALWRCELGTALIDRFDAPQRRLWAQQVQIAWQFSRPGLLALARRDAAAQALFTLAFASEPELLRQFEVALSER